VGIVVPDEISTPPEGVSMVFEDNGDKVDAFVEINSRVKV
jgi:hypothetical protein